MSWRVPGDLIKCPLHCRDEGCCGSVDLSVLYETCAQEDGAAQGVHAKVREQCVDGCPVKTCCRCTQGCMSPANPQYMHEGNASLQPLPHKPTV